MQKDFLPVLHKVMTKQNACFQPLAKPYKLLVTLASNTANRVTILDTGFLEPLRDVLEAHTDWIGVVRRVCQVVAKVCFCDNAHCLAVLPDDLTRFGPSLFEFTVPANGSCLWGLVVCMCMCLCAGACAYACAMTFGLIVGLTSCYNQCLPAYTYSGLVCLVSSCSVCVCVSACLSVSVCVCVCVRCGCACVPHVHVYAICACVHRKWQSQDCTSPCMHLGFLLGALVGQTLQTLLGLCLCVRACCIQGIA